MTSQLLQPSVRRPADNVASPALPPLKHFIDGSFVDSDGDDRINLENPALGEFIDSVPAGTATDVDRAVNAARAALSEWAATTPRERSELLHKIADIIVANAEELGRLEALNTGKPDAVVADDIASVVDTFRFAAGAGRALTSLAAGDYADGHTSVILREPVGVVGVITPWNYPLLMAAWKIAPILVAGNTLVLKPSEQTPLSTLRLAELIAEEVPHGVLNIVTGYGPVVGHRLSEHPGIDLVALTGSVGSGRAVAAAAAPTLKRVHLELGGKAPVVVFADADLEAVAAGVRNAGFWNAGQECGAACRVLVHESVSNELTGILTREISQMVVGAPNTGDDVEVGSMISKTHFERVIAALNRAREQGATFATGGSAIDTAGFYIEPTLIVDAPLGADITQKEVFGPVVSIETFSTDEEAISRANETPYGLAASVWTKDASRSLSAPKRLDFGTVWVNSHLALACEVPWGGFKGSGYGRDLSSYAIDDFSRSKHVMHNHSG